jgi:hypothetical protein
MGKTCVSSQEYAHSYITRSSAREKPGFSEQSTTYIIVAKNCANVNWKALAFGSLGWWTGMGSTAFWGRTRFDEKGRFCYTASTVIEKECQLATCYLKKVWFDN